MFGIKTNCSVIENYTILTVEPTLLHTDYNLRFWAVSIKLAF